MMRHRGAFPLLALLLAGLAVPASAGARPATAGVPLSGIGRFQGWRDNALIGYGLVTGLAGSGDTRRNGVTRQALRNVLSRLGTSVTDDEINSRNVAVVIVTSTLPASANVGDRLTVTVSSIGDARSLAGGTLLMTPLLGPDQHVYALAQGPLLAGGYDFKSDLNREQRNYPTTAMLEAGATVETAVDTQLLASDGTVGFVLSEPSFEGAERIAEAINLQFGAGIASVKNADEVRIAFRGDASQFAGFMARLESLPVEPVRVARVVINERTGTIVAGGDVRISSVVIAQGDLKVTITGERTASQPNFAGGFASDLNSVGSLVVTNTKLTVEDRKRDTVVNFPNTTVADLVQGLSRAKVDTRGIISVLQAIKAAGALHAAILVQ
ncbi:flagellar basal body P-ring protein FlgI [Sphingomonas mali]|uniref:flagellar basal body P-ring protein FlgI n=1 Tax=Sphingomonas mali TaxID=40682 RepID=UPI00082F4A08|nr:flagellar basal body P-ring protein FlgI [Sphingomonas mali]